MNVFISYRRRHGGKANAQLLSQKLRTLGINVFFDLVSLQNKNTSYKEEIKKNIENSDYFLLLLQPQMFRDLVGNDLVNEICLAHQLKKEIVAIPLDASFDWNAEMPLPSELEEIGLPNLQLMVEVEDITTTSTISCRLGKLFTSSPPLSQEIAKAMAANTTITLVRDNFRRFITTYYSKYLYRHTAPNEPSVQ